MQREWGRFLHGEDPGWPAGDWRQLAEVCTVLRMSTFIAEQTPVTDAAGRAGART